MSMATASTLSTRTSSPSAALELGPALLREGPHALLVVLAVEAVGDQLVEHAGVPLGRRLYQLVDRGLGRLEREGRVAGHGLRVVAREGLQLILGHHLVDQAHPP